MINNSAIIVSALQKWILASRPKTLPAAIVPVGIGGALAAAMDAFSLVPWMICMVFAVLIQIGTNFANDYYDYQKGADDERRIGPKRAVASGWISPSSMKSGMIIVYLVAFMFGCLLVPYGGWWLILIGILSILCGIAYTGGPYPLGYNGWGDVFVFIFFGWVATGCTFYVQQGSFAFSHGSLSGAIWILLAGSVPGALATNLLVVNNVRDAPLDREAGKRTLVARFGRKFGVYEYGLMALLTILIPIVFAVNGNLPGCYLILIVLPLFVRTVFRLNKAVDRLTYNSLLGTTALLLILGGALFAIGLLV